VAEIELARLGLAELPGTDLDVVVGGLGLGYTAGAVLKDPRVRSLVVVEALGEVVQWHERELLPDTAGLTLDPRTRLHNDDFFAMADVGFDPVTPGRRFHAILVDIDHSPRHVLHPSHAAFYTVAGLRQLSRHLQPGGIFALGSDDSPDALQDGGRLGGSRRWPGNVDGQAGPRAAAGVDWRPVAPALR